MKKLFSLGLTLLFVLSLGIVSFATEVTPKVIFSANDEKFSFENVADSETIDLFVGFKNVIPGDKIIQNIDVQIKDLEETDTVKIYLKSETTDEVYTELLNSIKITVKNGDENITAKLSEQVLLGTFEADEIVNLSVTLEIPVAVGNEIQSLEASTDWIFTAQILEDTNIPQTGDNNNNILWIGLVIISLFGIMTIKVKRIKT